MVKCKTFRASVGAMKIARNVAVSEWYDEWCAPLPAPSLRELLSVAKLRECSSMNVTAQKFQSLYALVSKPSARRNHRTTLPQSALAGCQLPQRGSREWAVPFTRPPGNRKGSGDFHRPYETLMILVFTIHRSTLPQSRFRSTAPSEREPGNVPIHRGTR